MNSFIKMWFCMKITKVFFFLIFVFIWNYLNNLIFCSFVLAHLTALKWNEITDENFFHIIFFCFIYLLFFVFFFHFSLRCYQSELRPLCVFCVFACHFSVLMPDSNKRKKQFGDTCYGFSTLCTFILIFAGHFCFWTLCRVSLSCVIIIISKSTVL